MELVKTKKNEIFTDSLVIANGTNNQHHIVTRLIRNYETQFNSLGKLGFKIQPSLSGQKIKIYELNEPQATFLMTLLRNSDVVVDFKLKLTREFYHMRSALLERQTSEWQQTRIKGKLVRRNETDTLARLKIYAEHQREGKPYPHVYTNYTKLVNSAIGIKSGQRNIASFKQLQMISLLEDMVEHTVIEEMQKGVFLKEIFKKCKSKVNTFVSLMYLDRNVKKIKSVS